LVGRPGALDIGGAVQAEVLGLRLGDDGIELTGPQGRPQSNEELLNLQAGLCLDDPSGRTTNGIVPQIWNCLGNQAQNYAFGYCTGTARRTCQNSRDRRTDLSLGAGRRAGVRSRNLR